MRNAFVMLLFVVSTTGTALAQDTLTAEEHYELATNHYRHRRFIEAAQQYALAFEKAQAPELAYNAARAFDRAAAWREAQRYYQVWLAGVPPIAEKTKLAAKLREEGLRAGEEGDPELGIKRVTFAMRLKATPDPDFAFELGQLYEQAGKRVLAKEMYRKALSEGFSDSDALEAALQRLERIGRMGRVVLLGNATGIRVRVDGKVVPGGDADREFQLEAGKHRIQVEKQGHRPWHGRVEVRTGQLTTVPFTLQRLASGAQSRVRRPTTPPRRPGAKKPSRSGFAGAPPTLSWVAGGVGGVAIAAGIVFGSLASGAEQQLEDCRERFECAVDPTAPGVLGDRAGNRAFQANIALGVGAVGAVAAVVFWAVNDAGETWLDASEDDDLALRYDGDTLGAAWRF